MFRERSRSQMEQIVGLEELEIVLSARGVDLEWSEGYEPDGEDYFE